MPDKIIATFIMERRGRSADLELPLSMTAQELIVALNQAYVLGLDTEDLSQCYLACENPTAPIRGGRTLREIGLRNGSAIYFTR